MTPAERAEKLVTIESDGRRDWHTLRLGVLRLFTVYQGEGGLSARRTAEVHRDGYVRLVADAIRAAVLAERERCARVGLAITGDESGCCRETAEMISDAILAGGAS